MNETVTNAVRQDVDLEDHFISEKELLGRIPICRRTLFSWRESKKIPAIKAGGGKTIYHWPTVKERLLRYSNIP